MLMWSFPPIPGDISYVVLCQAHPLNMWSLRTLFYMDTNIPLEK